MAEQRRRIKELEYDENGEDGIMVGSVRGAIVGSINVEREMMV